jgi:predicted metalloprotease
MRWKGRRVSTNVEDRRGGGGAKAGGISIIGLIVAFVAWKFFGVDPQQAYQATQAVTSAQSSQQGVAPQNLTAEQKEASDFVGTILADTEDTWTPIFQKLGMTYTPPRLVLFSGVDKSACGRAQAAMGPFYCPADQKVYIDTAFFKDMRQQMGISGEQNQTELSRQDQAGILHRLMLLRMKSGIIFKIYWASLVKYSKHVHKLAKHKEISFLSV